MQKKLDFTTLPLNEVIYILRRLGTRLIDELLSPPCPPGKALPVKPQPEFGLMLTKPDIKALAHAHIWKLKRSLNPKIGRLPKNLREELPHALSKIIPKSIKGKISPHQWDVTACNRLALALGGTAGDVLPDHFWTVISEAAWSNPDFQLSIALKINDWLRKMRILVPYELPLVILNPTTFWVLIALVNVKPLKIPSWFLKKERAGLRIGRRLEQESQWQIMKNHWAGFWDQWIIQLTSQRWPSAYGKLEGRLCRALLSLPYLRTTANSALCQKKKVLKISPWVMVEKFFDIIDGVRRLPKPKNEYRRIAMINFAVPEWESQMPAFFKTTDQQEQYDQQVQQNQPDWKDQQEEQDLQNQQDQEVQEDQQDE